MSGQPHILVRSPGRLSRFIGSDLVFDFRRSPAAIISALAILTVFVVALIAPWIAPQNPYDLKALSIVDAQFPPAFLADGDERFLLGTDDQGRDILSLVLLGLRTSLAVGFLSVALAMVVGVVLGLVAGYRGGWLDSLIMRVADIQLTFPAILTALMLDGIVGAAFGSKLGASAEFWVLILAIGSSFWVQYARVVRSQTVVEREKDYVQAAKLIGTPTLSILFNQILPNVFGPVLVIATINLGLAVITEATLSFLGVGLPATEPSLGTLIRIGGNYLYSGEWWTSLVPGFALVVLVLSINVFGDWLRDALNPKLR